MIQFQSLGHSIIQIIRLLRVVLVDIYHRNQGQLPTEKKQKKKRFDASIDSLKNNSIKSVYKTKINLLAICKCF